MPPLVEQSKEEREERYLRLGGAFCLFCGKRGIEVRGDKDVEHEGDSILQSVHCPSCKRSWLEVYRLVAVQENE